MIAEVANLLIRKHGIDAELEAAKRADLMLNRGDDEGRPLGARGVITWGIASPARGRVTRFRMAR